MKFTLTKSPKLEITFKSSNIKFKSRELDAVEVRQFHIDST